MAQSQDLITEHVKTEAERLNNKKIQPADYEALDVEYKTGADGTIKEIYLTVTTGGPHIELHLYSKKIVGYWGSNKHEYPLIQDLEKDQTGVKNFERLAEFYHNQAKDVTLQ